MNYSLIIQSLVHPLMFDKKNILFVTTYNPYLLRTGAHQRTHHLFEALKTWGNVDTLFFNLYDKDVAVRDVNIFAYDINIDYGLFSKALNCMWVNSPTIIAPLNKKCSCIYKETVARKDYAIIVFRYLPTAVMCGVKNYKNIVIDLDDIPWHNYYRMAQIQSYSWLKRLYFYIKSWGIKRQSFRIMSNCKLYYTANLQDSLTPNARYLPNIPAIFEEKDYLPTCNNNILFVGFMGFPPNYQGVDHFIRNIWNNVVSKYPDASFFIAGKGTPEDLKRLWESYPNVHVLGYIGDLKELYRKCFIVVSPIYSGAGTNIKVLEALSMKKACIISKFAFKGFGDHFIHGIDLLVAESDHDYIQLLDSVLANIEKLVPIASHGYTSVLKNYTFESVRSIIKQTLFSSNN